MMPQGHVAWLDEMTEIVEKTLMDEQSTARVTGAVPDDPTQTRVRSRAEVDDSGAREERAERGCVVLHVTLLREAAEMLLWPELDDELMGLLVTMGVRVVAPLTSAFKRVTLPSSAMGELGHLTFFQTNTRMLGAIVDEAHPEVVIHHSSREERLDQAGTLLGVDISKRGTSVGRDKRTCVRRVDPDAVKGARWVVDVEAESEVDMTQLLEVVSQDVRVCQNDSYRAAFDFMKALCADGKAELHIFSQACGVKIGVFRAPMAKREHRREYAKLLREANGASEERESFNMDAESRWILTEPYDTNPGYFIDEERRVYDVGGEGRFPATAVYNKPDTDVGRDWIQITCARAVATLQEHGRKIPLDAIRILRRVCETIAADGDEER